MMFVGMLMLGLILVFGASLVGETAAVYNVSVDDDSFGATTTSMANIYSESDTIRENLQEQEVSDTDSIDEMVRGGYTSVRTPPFVVLSAGLNITNQIAKETGWINPSIITFVSTSFLVVLCFALIYLIFRVSTR